MRTVVKIYLIELKQTLRLAFPIIFSQLGQILLGLIDSVMVGRVGAVPLAASAFSTSLFSIFLVFGLGVSSGISTLIAHANGAGKNEDCGAILKHGVFLNLLVAVFLAVCIELLRFRLDWFGQAHDVAKDAGPFLCLLGWSIIPLLVFQAFRQFTEGLSSPKSAMMMIGLCILLNTALNWVLIYGNLGFPAMGLMGAGVATLVSRVAIAVLFAVYVLNSVRFEEQMPKNWRWKIDFSKMRDLLKLGLPAGFQYLFEVGAFASAAMMMGWFGAKELAAHQIAIGLAALTFMVAMGISFAVNIRVGDARGRGDLHAIKRIGFGGMAAGALVMGVCGLFFLLGRDIWPLLYISDASVIELSSYLLVIAAIFQIFDGAQGVAVGALRGLADVRIPTLITFVAYWVISLPLAYLLAFTWGWGPGGIWWALCIGLAFAAIFLSARFYKLTLNRI